MGTDCSARIKRPGGQDKSSARSYWSGGYGLFSARALIYERRRSNLSESVHQHLNKYEGGGRARKSDEAAVMAVEQRGPAVGSDSNKKEGKGEITQFHRIRRSPLQTLNSTKRCTSRISR
jgi:hypothetical protein